MSKSENGSRVSVKQSGSEAKLLIWARNSFVINFIRICGWFSAFVVITIGLAGIRNGDFGNLIVSTGLAGIIFWGTWRVTAAPKKFTMQFNATGLKIGNTYFKYSDISFYGISSYGGAPYDPVSMPIPRNYTPEPHLYIDHLGRRIPITIGLKYDHAQKVFAEFDRLFKIFSRKKLRVDLSTTSHSG